MVTLAEILNLQKLEGIGKIQKILSLREKIGLLMKLNFQNFVVEVALDFQRELNGPLRQRKSNQVDLII